MDQNSTPPPSRLSAEIHPAPAKPRNGRAPATDADMMARPAPLTEDAALKDAALALADATTLREMARDHLRSSARGMPRSHLLTRLRQSQMSGRDAVQYLDGIQLEAAFARARVRRHPAQVQGQPRQSDRARQKSAAIAARMLLFAPASDVTPEPQPKPARRRAQATTESASSSLPVRTFLAIDFETATNRRDSACAVGAVLLEDGVAVAEFRSLLRPPWLHVDPRHASIHGLDANALAQAPSFRQAFPQLEALIERADVIVAHNAGFDRSVFEASCRTARLPIPKTTWLCTVALARKAFVLPAYKLPTVAAHLGLALDHHDAMSDARACAQIFQTVLSRQPKLVRQAKAAAEGRPKAHSAFAAVPAFARARS